MTLSPPIFLVSRFRSGSTFLWNIFRQDPRYKCFYEPLHDNLREAIEVDVSPMESHVGTTSYWDEYKSMARDLVGLHRSQFGIDRLFLGPHDAHPELAEFIRYLIRNAERENRTCVIKCTRIDFRVPWLRTTFPEARIIHLTRNPRDQWISSVHPHKPENWDRLEENRGYDLPTWVASLAQTWPFLLKGPGRPAYYYSYLLWKLSRLFGEKFAHLTLDFDRDVAEEPDRLGQSLAPFFAPDFFARAEIKSLFHAAHPGGWRRYRTPEWFDELETQAEKTLGAAGVYRKNFWQWPEKNPAEAKQIAAEAKAVELALYTFSRHRGELLVHSHQLQVSVKVAQEYARSLKDAHEKASKALTTVDGERTDATNRLRLLQAVYDSLKQAHELSLNSLNKMLEEFQFTTKELRQIISYKDEQLQQITRNLPAGHAALLLAGQPLPGPTSEEIALARAAEEKVRQEMQAIRETTRQLETQLASAGATVTELRAQLAKNESALKEAQNEITASRELRRHAAALENTVAQSWVQATQARARLEEMGATQGRLETALADQQTNAARQASEFQHRIETGRNRILAIEREAAETKEALAAAHASLGVQTAELETRNARLEAGQQALAAQKKNVTDLTAELVALQSVVAEKSDLLGQAKLERDLLQARLSEEKAGRTREKLAYDERAQLLNAQLRDAHGEKAGVETARLREVTALHEQLARMEAELRSATARLAAIEASWTGALVRRFVPAASSTDLPGKS